MPTRSRCCARPGGGSRLSRDGPATGSSAGADGDEIAAAVDAAMRDGRASTGPRSRRSSRRGPTAPAARPADRPGRWRTGRACVLDFGGVYDGYCVDLTRTVHLGPMPEAFRRLFEAVAGGAGGGHRGGAAGRRSGAIDGAARPVLERHGLGEAFGHGTGHGLGLEVHEEPRIAPPAAGRRAAVEPGWSSRSSRAPTCRASAACGSKTTCW